MEPSRSLPSLRKPLIKLHRDLLVIEGFVRWNVFDPFLSDFEKIVLILEDRRFLSHGGVDIKACAREIFKCFLGRRHGGASTIDMQFVRTATGYRELTLRRKLYEILLSVLIQYRYSKIQILRSYLDCAFFGSGMIGIHRATNWMYEKAPVALDKNEAARLAAMLVYPRPLAPDDIWERRVDRRAEYGLRRMLRFEKLFEKIPSGE